MIRHLYLALLLALAAGFTGCSRDTAPAVVAFPTGVRHEAFDSLLKKHVNDAGLVNYSGWKASAADRRALDDYLAQFSPKPATPAAGDELSASAINAYNAFTIRWILENYPTKSIQALGDSFKAKRHLVGGERVSLDEIEHQTLRPHIGWRAHSALVCAARSCPPLLREAMTPATVNAQIDAAYRKWLAREDLNRFLPAKKKAQISSIFTWFEEDFTEAGGVGSVLARYAPEQYQHFLGSGGYTIEHLPYNWGLNDQAEGKDYSRTRFYWDQVTGIFR